MPRSKFRLEPLLKIRQLEEDRAKRAVAERVREIQAVQERIAQIDGQLFEASGTMRSLVLAGRIVPLEASRQRGYIGSLQMQRLVAMAELQGLQGKLVVDRVALAETGKRRKILDKLKERQEQRTIRIANLAEQRVSDELGVLRFVHDQLDADCATDGEFDSLAAAEIS
jgi:flagellar export protein FliJ